MTVAGAAEETGSGIARLAHRRRAARAALGHCPAAPWGIGGWVALLDHRHAARAHATSHSPSSAAPCS